MQEQTATTPKEVREVAFNCICGKSVGTLNCSVAKCKFCGTLFSVSVMMLRPV